MYTFAAPYQTKTLMYDLIYTDDDLVGLELARDAFEQIGWAHRVLLLNSGKAVIQYLDGLTDPLDFPHLLVLDYHLKEMTGEDLLVLLRSHPKCRDLQAVAFSTVLSRSDMERLRQLDAKCCVSKPASLKGYSDLATRLKLISGELEAGLEPSFDLLS